MLREDFGVKFEDRKRTAKQKECIKTEDRQVENVRASRNIANWRRHLKRGLLAVWRHRRIQQVLLLVLSHCGSCLMEWSHLSKQRFHSQTEDYVVVQDVLAQGLLYRWVSQKSTASIADMQGTKCIMVCSGRDLLNL